MSWHLCNDCGGEFCDDMVPDFDVDAYGCPVCGGHDIDDEVE
jgi:hypothetical protein